MLPQALYRGKQAAMIGKITRRQLTTDNSGTSRKGENQTRTVDP